MKRILFFVGLILLISVACAKLAESDKNARLVRAAKRGKLSMVQTLLSEGMSPDTRDDDGVPVLMWASENGHIEVVKLLLDNGADVNIERTKDGTTVLMETAEEGHTDVVKLLLDNGAEVNTKRTKDGITALMEAADEGHTEIVKLLLDNGAEVNAKKTTDGTTALMEAADEGRTEVVKLLLDKGVEVNAKRTKDGTTALMEAAEGGRTEIVKLLLAKGADVNAKAVIHNVEWTALKAAKKERNTNIVKMLEKAGANEIVDITDTQYDQIALSNIILYTSAQETYYLMDATFCDSLEELEENSEYEGEDLEISPGVTIDIEQADDDGYVMKSSHEKGQKIYMSRFSFSKNIHDDGDPEISEIVDGEIKVLRGMMERNR